MLKSSQILCDLCNSITIIKQLLKSIIYIENTIDNKSKHETTATPPKIVSLCRYILGIGSKSYKNLFTNTWTV